MYLIISIYLVGAKLGVNKVKEGGRLPWVCFSVLIEFWNLIYFANIPTGMFGKATGQCG